MKNCSNIECRNGPEDICYDGVEPVTECLQYGKFDGEELLVEGDVDGIAQEALQEEVDEPEAFESEYVRTHSGDILFTNEASDIIQQYGGQVVACVGPSDVGKTTLISSLYELFGEGAVGAYSFAKEKLLIQIILKGPALLNFII
jgi:hypothetical protein